MPGVVVKLQNAATPQSLPTSTGKLFAVVQSERGSGTEPGFVGSMSEYEVKYGKPITGSNCYDWIEAALNEGVHELVIIRAISTTAVVAKAEPTKLGGGAVLKVEADNAGVWGNKLSVEIKAGTGSNYIIVVKESGLSVEESPEFATNKEAVEWSKKSLFVNVVEINASLPEAGKSYTLTTGSDGGALAEAEVKTALAAFIKDLGCGQLVCYVLGTNSSVQKEVLKHCEENNRTALIDMVQKGANEPIATFTATLLSAVAALRTAAGARRGLASAQWIVVPGRTVGTTRTVPGSALIAGVIARLDASAKVPLVGEPPAGIENGALKTALGVEAEWSKQQREELDAKNLVPARVMPGGLGICIYGDKTLTPATVEPAWEKISAARLYMYVCAEGERIMEKNAFKDIDPKNLLFSKIQTELTSMMLGLSNQIQNNPATAVNTGPAVNTKETIAKNEALAAITVQPDAIAETLTLTVTTIPPTAIVAA